MSIDPVIAAGPDRLLPYSWDDVIDHDVLNKSQKSFFSEADDFKLRHGLSIPVHGHGGEYALMTLVADGTAGEAKSNIAEARHMLHLMTLYYHNRAGAMLIEQAMSTFNTPLTVREKDVLCWTAQGKTARDIGDILGIAETTAVYHMENAKQKLNALTRTQAVVKAISLKLIQF